MADVHPSYAPISSLERELQGLRKLYGAKFNAISSALGHVGEARLFLFNDDPDAADAELAETERILSDA